MIPEFGNRLGCPEHFTRPLNAPSHRSRRPSAVMDGIGVKWGGCWEDPLAWNSLIPFHVTVWVEFAPAPLANPHFDADSGKIIAFPGEIFGLVTQLLNWTADGLSSASAIPEHTGSSDCPGRKPSEDVTAPP